MYQPTTDLLEGIRSMSPAQLFPWDEYFPRMAETDFLAGRHDVAAAKSFFMRQAPFGGSYALLGGITAALREISDLRFDSDDFQSGMRDLGYRPGFLDWLRERKHLRLQLWAPPEGTAFFPNEPIVTVQGPLPDIRLVEGILTESLNFPSLSLTKWHRLVRTVQPGQVLEFSRRRAQHAFKTSLYAMLAGCFATSNSEMRRFFDCLVIGTMGHEWIQSFGSVAVAFDVWLTHQPQRPVGLVDTKQCLKHDFPLWLEAVRKHRESITAADPAIWGWRNDSGDLAYLTIEQFRIFMNQDLATDPWFRDRMRIVLTNELDEYAASSIIAQIRTQAGEAGFDAEDILRRIIWAAGTKPGTCDDQPSLGGVAKLVECDGYPTIKLAFDADGRPGIKTSIPGNNRSSLIVREGQLACVLVHPPDWIADADEPGEFYDPAGEYPAIQSFTACHPDNEAARMGIRDYVAIPQQALVWDSLAGNGFVRSPDTVIRNVTDRISETTNRLHWTSRRLVKPHLVKVSLTESLFDLRQRMIRNGQLTAKWS